MESINLSTIDGAEISGAFFEGGSQGILLGAAMATPQKFYWDFAQYLQARGYSVLTYDFRGVGASAPKQLKGFVADLEDWALLDQLAALEWLKPRSDSLSIIGHSFGGQVAGLLGDRFDIQRMVTVCSQSGYWRLQGGHQWWQALLHMSITFPLLSRLYGYMPWSKFGTALDVPKGAAIQWARWCRHPDYLFGDHSLPLERYQDFDCPILAFSIDDDDWGTARSVDALMGHYPNVERRHIVPSDWGIERLGHTGFFKSKSEALWNSVVEWMEEN